MNRTWKLIIAAVLLVFIAVLVPVVLVIRFARPGMSLNSEIARIKAEGAPVCAADLAGKPIPASENAAVVYQKCFAYLPKSESADSNTLGNFLDSEKRAADPTLWAQAKVVLKRHALALPLAERAAAMHQCRFPVEWAKAADALFPHLSRLRELSRVLAAQALVDAKDGRMAETAHHIGLIYRTSNSVSDEPNLMSQLVRYACISIASRGLRQCAAVGRLAENDARDLSAKISRVDLSSSLQRAWLGERATGITMFAEMRKGRIGVGGDEKTIRRFYGSTPGGMWINNDEYYYLTEMRRYSAGASMPYRVLRAKHLDSDPDMPRYAIMSAIFLPCYSRANASRDRAVANLAGDRIFLGLLAYHDQIGSYPVTLDELRTKLNWQLPEDPFSGKSFVYRAQGKGFILYTIDEDLKDNGGIEPDSNKPGDIVWKLDK